MSVRAWPYRTPAEGRVVAQPWLLETDSLVELPAVLDGWDYTTDLILVRRLEVDLSGCLSDSALPPDTPLRVCVRLRPSTSKIRSRIAGQVLTSGAVEVRGKAHGAELAGTLGLETTLELAVDIPSSGRLNPTRAGSVLWRDKVSTVLEGDSGLLPIAPVSFAQAGLPANAAWYLSLDAGRWEWTAMGSLIVLLNSDNPAVASALVEPAAPGSSRILETMQVDFVGDLVSRALLDDGFWAAYVDPDHPADDDLSVGALVRALVRTRLCLPTETVDEALVRLKDLLLRDPSLYRARVQEGLRYLEGNAP